MENKIVFNYGENGVSKLFPEFISKNGKPHSLNGNVLPSVNAQSLPEI